MRIAPFAAFLALILTANPCPADKDVGVDVENIPTPLTLPELLPLGGIQAVKIDFWMRIQASYKGQPMDTRFIHWHVEPVAGELVFYDGQRHSRK